MRAFERNINIIECNRKAAFDAASRCGKAMPKEQSD
jgi:hypothetical protein